MIKKILLLMLLLSSFCTAQPNRDMPNGSGVLGNKFYLLPVKQWMRTNTDLTPFDSLNKGTQMTVMSDPTGTLPGNVGNVVQMYYMPFSGTVSSSSTVYDENVWAAFNLSNIKHFYARGWTYWYAPDSDGYTCGQRKQMYFNNAQQQAGLCGVTGFPGCTHTALTSDSNYGTSPYVIIPRVSSSNAPPNTSKVGDSGYNKLQQGWVMVGWEGFIGTTTTSYDGYNRFYYNGVYDPDLSTEVIPLSTASRTSDVVTVTVSTPLPSNIVVGRRISIGGISLGVGGTNFNTYDFSKSPTDPNSDPIVSVASDRLSFTFQQLNDAGSVQHFADDSGGTGGNIYWPSVDYEHTGYLGKIFAFGDQLDTASCFDGTNPINITSATRVSGTVTFNFTATIDVATTVGKNVLIGLVPTGTNGTNFNTTGTGCTVTAATTHSISCAQALSDDTAGSGGDFFFNGHEKRLWTDMQLFVLDGGYTINDVPPANGDR